MDSILTYTVSYLRYVIQSICYTLAFDLQYWHSICSVLWWHTIPGYMVFYCTMTSYVMYVVVSRYGL